MRAPDLQEAPPPPHRGAQEPSALTAVWLRPPEEPVPGSGSSIVSALRGVPQTVPSADGGRQVL